MKRLQAYQYVLKPNGDQQRAMGRFAGACRFVFNKALALQKTNYEAGQVHRLCGDGKTADGVAERQ